MPHTLHAQDHWSREAIGDTIDWMQRTLQGGRPLPPGDQIWYWKEVGTLLAFLGLIAALFPLGDWLLRRRFFAELREAATPVQGLSGARWWSAAALNTAIPILTYFPLYNLGTRLLPASAVFPQSVTTGIMFWTAGNAAISLALFALWHFTAQRRRGTGAAAYGLAGSHAPLWRTAGKSLLLAIGLIALLHGLLSIAALLFGIDFRFWVAALRPLDLLHVRIFLRYAAPFVAYFIVLGLVLHSQLHRRDAPLGREMLANAGLLTAGFAALLLVQYVPLLAGAALPLGEPLLTIVAFQFLPLLAIAALVSTYFFRKTGRVYVGAFVNALFVTWYIVAGQATHFAL
jgi:hypothetical protein